MKEIFNGLKKTYKGLDILFFGTIETTPETNNERHHIHFLLKVKNTNQELLKKHLEYNYKEGTDVKRYDYKRYGLEGVNYVLKNKEDNTQTYKEHYIIRKTRPKK